MKVKDVFEYMVDLNSIHGITRSKNHDRIKEKRVEHYKKMKKLRKRKQKNP